MDKARWLVKYRDGWCWKRGGIPYRRMYRRGLPARIALAWWKL